MKRSIFILTILLGLGAISSCANNEPTIQSITIDDVGALGVGETKSLGITYTPLDGNLKGVNWNISSGTSISINESGLVTALNVGESIVRATLISNPSITNELTITVVPARVTGLSIDQTFSDPVSLTYEEQLSVSFLPETPVDTSVIWTISTGNSVTITSNGYVKASSVGETTIRASYIADMSIYDEKNIIVSDFIIPVTHLAINGNSSNDLYAGDFRNLTVDYVPNNTTQKGIIWSSSNPEVAHVSASGVITGISQGNTIIRATSVENPSIFTTVNIIVSFKTKLDQIKYEIKTITGADISALPNLIDDWILLSDCGYDDIDDVYKIALKDGISSQEFSEYVNAAEEAGFVEGYADFNYVIFAAHFDPTLTYSVEFFDYNTHGENSICIQANSPIPWLGKGLDFSPIASINTFFREKNPTRNFDPYPIFDGLFNYVDAAMTRKTWLGNHHEFTLFLSEVSQQDVDSYTAKIIEEGNYVATTTPGLYKWSRYGFDLTVRYEGTNLTLILY